MQFAEVDLDEDDDGEGDAVQEDEDGGSSEEEEEEEGESDEFIDVLDVLDGRGMPDLGEDDATGSATEATKDADARAVGARVSRAHEVNGDGSEGEDDEEDGGDDDSDDDSDDEDDDLAMSGSDEDLDPSAIDNLTAFVSGLPSTSKRKAPAHQEEGQPPPDGQRPSKKKKFIPERTESGVENEFGVRPSG